MPAPSKRSKQAKQQRKGRKVFGSNLTDNPLDRLVDPDFVPSDDDAQTDSDGEEISFTFSLVEHLGEVSDDSGDESSEASAGEELKTSGKKRGLDEDDSEDDSEESDAELHEIFDCMFRTEIKTSKKPRTMAARATYSGAGTSTVYRKKAEMKKAAVGSGSITNFFAKSGSISSRVPQHSAPSLRVPAPQIPDMLFSLGDGLRDYARPPPTTPSPTPSARSETDREPSVPAPATPSLDSDATGPSNAPDDWVARLENEFAASPASFLDLTADDEDEPEQEPVYDVVKRLLKDAQRHKSFHALFKLNAVKNFLELRENHRRNPKVKNPAMRASHAVAKGVGKGAYFARQIRHLTLYIQRFRRLPPNGSGKHHAHPSLLNDERVAQAVRRYLTVTAVGEVDPKKLAHEVNNVIIPNLNLGLNLDKNTISERCAARWLHKLGYACIKAGKGVYFDGHERPDVVKSREMYVANVTAGERQRRIYRDEDLEAVEPQLLEDEVLHVPLFHDECICRSNSLKSQIWSKDRKMPLRKKGEGKAIHISDFIVEETGTLFLTEEEIAAQARLPEDQRLPERAREIIYPGKNADGWWNSERLIAQVKRTIPLFEKKFPGAVAEFFFDQSSAHGAFASDSLNANEMNVNPGGKQRHMHDTVIPESNPNPELRGKTQTMVFDKDLPPSHPYYDYRGQPKGMRVVLEERGLMEGLREKNGGKALVGDCAECKLSQKAKEKLAREREAEMAGLDEEEETTDDIHHPSPSAHCCMRKVMSVQDDFLAEKPLLQIIIEKAGHRCYFIPKFHCELNPIEMYWGWVKMRYRNLADGTWKRAKELVRELLDACPVKTIRAFFRKCWRYVDAYKKGLNAKQAEFAVKKYRSHRRVPARVMMDVDIMNNPL